MTNHDYTWFTNEGDAIRYLSEDGWRRHPPSGIWTRGNERAEIIVIDPNGDVRIIWYGAE